jgi:simple sugar transport system ATP-binding protein
MRAAISQLQGRLLGSGRELALVAIPSVLIVLGVFYAAYRLVDPLPPARFAISAGTPESSYWDYAQRYRATLARDGVDLEVRAGEIVGVAGVEGNGQDELVEAIVGLRRVQAGRILLKGSDVTGRPTRKRLHAGISYIPADRHRQGIVLELPVSDNLILDDYDEPPFARWLVRQFQAVREYARRLIKAFDIRAGGPDQPTNALSGGNQQKVVVARELSTEPRVLVAAQPTRGVDVGSIEFIHRQIVSQRDAGLAVLLVSSELDEVLSLADRVAVIYRGRIVSVLENEAIERDRIGLLMAGIA